MLQETPMISLIVPAYNVSLYIDAAIKSVVGQSYENWEVIIVDDGSVDGTAEICDQWASKDRRVYVLHQENSGVCSARNSALSIARGDIIGFLDADDILSEKNALKEIVNMFHAHPVDAIFTSHVRINEEGELISKYILGEGIKSQREAVITMLDIQSGSALGVLWNKYFLRKCVYFDGKVQLFDSEYAIGEDQIWLLEVMSHVKQVYCSSFSSYQYRIRQGSAIHQTHWDNRQHSELLARQKMVCLSFEKFGETAQLYADIKYWNCIRKHIIFVLKKCDRTIGTLLKPYIKWRYEEFMMASEIPRKSKVERWLAMMLFRLLY